MRGWLQRRLRSGLWLGVCLPALAQAHLMPAGQGSVRLTADSAWLALAVPVAALQGWDEAGSGRITLAQLAAHRPALLAQLRARVRLDVAGERGRTLYEDLLFEAADYGAAGTEQLVLLRRDSWAAPVRWLRLHVDLGAAGSDGALSLRALRGTESEQVQFGPGQRDRSVFRSRARPLQLWLAAGLVALALAVRLRAARRGDQPRFSARTSSVHSTSSSRFCWTRIGR